MLHLLLNQALTQIATHEGTKYIFANVLREITRKYEIGENPVLTSKPKTPGQSQQQYVSLPTALLVTTFSDSNSRHRADTQGLKRGGFSTSTNSLIKIDMFTALAFATAAYGAYRVARYFR